MADQDDTSRPQQQQSDDGDAKAVLVTPDGSRIPITSSSSSSFVIGRQAAAVDLRIPHGSVSRQHVKLDYSSSSDTVVLVIRDLGGKHGTYVNDQRIAAQQVVPLQNGDVLRFGKVDTVYRVQVVMPVNGSSSSPPEKKQKSSNPSTDVATTKVAAADPGEGLSGRAKRQAEIAAMMASLDETPTYTVHREKEGTGASSNLPGSSSNNSNLLDDPETKKQQKIAKKHRLPVAQTFMLDNETERQNAVTSLVVDPAGARFAIGTTDNRLRFYDFAGMDQGRRDCFRSVVPDDGHWPVACAYSNTGDRILVGTNSVQPVVLDREGQEVIQFVRGDMYVTDQTKTVGHTAAVSAVDWHPFERDCVLTASLDGSARLWNLQGRTQFKMLVCQKVFSAKNAKGQRTAITACTFHPAGREFAVGTQCGSVQIWNPSRASGRAERAVYQAHAGPVVSLTYNVDGTKLASRCISQDDKDKAATVKVWNATRMSRSSVPIVTCQNANSTYEHANAAFSPDGRILCLGVTETKRAVDGDDKRRQEIGRLHFYSVSGDVDASSVRPLLSLDTPENCSPIIVRWHPKLNQIFVGCSGGRTMILYDPKWSTKGAVSAASKMGKSVDDLSLLLKSRAPTGSAGVMGEIVAPISLPMYREDRTSANKRKREARKDPVASHEPERPATGKHKTGGQAGSLNFAQFVADKNMAKSKVIAGKDPREALFQYTEGESFVEKAYEGNKSLLAEKTAEEEEEELKSRGKK